MTIAERRMERMVGSVAHVFDWFNGGDWQRHHLDPDVADFAFGNPQEMPLPGLVDALQRNAVPQDKDWFAYKFSEEEPREVVAASLRARTGIPFRAEDVAMTAGAFGALGVTIRALCDVDDEVIFLSPPWFFYELMIASSGRDGRPRPPGGPDFDLDPEAIAAAITPRTRAIIVNSPNNPTGRIYREPELAALGRGPARGLRTPRPADRPALGRVVQPDRLRRHRLPEPRPRLRRDDHDLHLRQDAAGARPADRLRGDVARLPRPRGDRLPDLRPAAGRRLGLPERPAPARHQRPRGALGGHPGAPGAARPDGAGAARDGLRGHASPRARST